MSVSGQEGIDRLLQAEQEATEIVAKARKGDFSLFRATRGDTSLLSAICVKLGTDKGGVQRVLD